MWWQEYADYCYEKPLKQETVETGKGIIGCEMHDRHGYGIEDHQYQDRKKRKKKSLIRALSSYLFGTKVDS